ncbi:unnamed protein product (macronuclear) [Paramecium tetraurelia]|uniref:RING-type domain-containing protein n=1 Tax=Paramecium tetraurelia TaxID=5888 RepID=A0D8L1_PARTE|nr:uncharacterized protein GSPATT00014324001 [Paramecium tetraurelia]CAK79378.1 unnamed protein product [Paramecium tetraurelia]|eukprot:XP_001446775.1 hypothetical protein (macronuclear) [Paramecium tetraurelia strain d4-2]
MQIEVEKTYNAYWPPKYDLYCMGSNCPVKCESKFGQEFYVSQIDCNLKLCPLCRFQEMKCTVPNCQISIEKHYLKTNFNLQAKRVFFDLDKDVQEQLSIRKKIEEKYHRQISDIKQSSKPTEKLDQLSEYFEDAVYAERSNNKRLMLEIDTEIQRLWRQIEIEEVNDQHREMPKQVPTPRHSTIQQQTGSQNSYQKEAGFNERQFHINRIKWGF